jgi:phytoene synthase
MNQSSRNLTTSPPPHATTSPPHHLALSQSYRYCESLARRQAGNFYHAFRLLPRNERRAISALYAFMRITDDVTDDPGVAADKRAALEIWRQQLDLALRGEHTHPVHPAIHDTVRSYRIPRAYLDDVLDGVGMDLEPVRFATFAELYRYCYRVASAVGLACIHIWGFSDERAKVHAESAGIAFQLTNILRDLGEDGARDRIYLPGEDLERFGYGEDRLRRGERGPQFRALMEFQASRARGYFDAAVPLANLLRPAGRAVFQVMTRTYRGLLDAIVARDYDVFSSRVSLSRWRKLWWTVQALPVRFGRALGD